MNAKVSAQRPFRGVPPREIWRVTEKDLPTVRSHAVTNTLYGARGLRVDGLLWHWQHGWPSRIQEWITLAADDMRLQLALDGDAIGFATRQIDWRNYTDETRLLAWTACHEPLLALLRTMFQCDWVPEGLGDCDAQPAGECVRAGFTVHKADGIPIVSGVTLLDADCVKRLAACTSFTHPRLHPALVNVHARLPVLLDDFAIDAAELSAITRGAIVRLDNRTLAGGVARVSIPAGHVRLLADVTDVRATVAGAAPAVLHSDSEGSRMSTESQSSTETPTVAVGSLPVRLTFSAGSMAVPFAALANIGPGFVFELEKRLDDQAIVIHANDVPIAHGELVVIGDLVGVRITRMLPKA